MNATKVTDKIKTKSKRQMVRQGKKELERSITSEDWVQLCNSIFDQRLKLPDQNEIHSFKDKNCGIAVKIHRKSKQ